MTALLEVEALDVFYGSVQALRGISLEVEEGERVALLGANGAGKSTTLRAVSGLVHARAGTVRFAGTDITRMAPHEIVTLGLAHLPEGRDLFPTLTVEENLRYGYYTQRKDRAGYVRRRDLVMDFFPKLRERSDQAAATMSGGEQQMLGVARALMSSPRLLCVDELSLGLAPIIVERLFEILHEVNRDGVSLLIVEQFVHMSLANTDRAYVLSKGGVVLEDESARLAGNPDLVASYLGESTTAEAPTPRRRRSRL
ncbi:MAG: ABC transporter ATP-binding protein [Actinomycetota bacterium]|nr:ABC transporter ATP-binding protein [Actinomycetota bacterium]